METRRTFLVRLADEQLLSLLVPIESQLRSPLFALMQQSYDRALGPLYALRRRVTLIGAAALAAALVVGALLAGGIAAPLQTLVGAMRDVLGGNLQPAHGGEARTTRSASSPARSTRWWRAWRSARRSRTPSAASSRATSRRRCSAAARR